MLVVLVVVVPVVVVVVEKVVVTTKQSLKGLNGNTGCAHSTKIKRKYLKHRYR